MNAGKLVAQIAVVAIVVYCCYGAIVSSLPTSMDEINQLKENPLEVTAPTLSGDCSGLTFNMTMTGGEITSHLPADVADVYIALYIGSGETKLFLGNIDIGTLQPGIPSAMAGSVSAPIYAIMAYATVSETADGQMSLPLCIKIGFKYFEWKGAHLVDLNITIKNSIPFAGTSMSYEVSGNEAKVSVNVTNGNGGILEDGMKTLKQYMEDEGYGTVFQSGPDGDTATIKVGDATLKIAIDTSSTDPKITFDAIGAGEKSAADIMSELLKDNGELNIAIEGYSGEIPPLDAENAEAFIEVINMLYSMGATS